VVAEPHGQLFARGSQSTVHIFIPDASAAQTWFGSPRQSASVAHSLQKLRRRQERSSSWPLLQRNGWSCPMSAASTQSGLFGLPGNPHASAQGDRLPRTSTLQ